MDIYPDIDWTSNEKPKNMKFKFQFPGGNILTHLDNCIEDATDFVCSNYNCEKDDFNIWEA